MGTINAVIFVSYLVLMFIALVYVRRARTTRDFAVGNRGFPAPIAFATLAATCIGPGFTVGLTGKASGGGLIWVGVFVFFSLQMVITGQWLAPKLRDTAGAYTLGDVLGDKFGTAAKFLGGVVAVLFCAGVIGAIARATGNFAEAILDVSPTWAIVISLAVVVVYSALGGIKAVILTDLMQFIVLAIGLPLIVFLELPQLTTESASFFTFNPTSMSAWKFGGLAVTFLFGEMLIPPYAQRALITEDAPAARSSFFGVAGFSVVWFFVMGCIGLIGTAMYPEADPGAVFFKVVQTALPVGLSGLVLASVLSVIASSQDSFLNAAAVAFTDDIIAPLVEIDEKRELISNQVVLMCVGIAAGIFAMFVPTIVDGLLVVYTLWAPVMIAPLVVALLSDNPSPYAGLSGMFLGGLITGIWKWVLLEPLAIPAILPGLAASFLVTLLVAYFGPKSAQSALFTPVPPEHRNNEA